MGLENKITRWSSGYDESTRKAMQGMESQDWTEMKCFSPFSLLLSLFWLRSYSSWLFPLFGSKDRCLSPHFRIIVVVDFFFLLFIILILSSASRRFVDFAEFLSCESSSFSWLCCIESWWLSIMCWDFANFDWSRTRRSAVTEATNTNTGQEGETVWLT